MSVLSLADLQYCGHELPMQDDAMLANEFLLDLSDPCSTKDGEPNCLKTEFFM